MSTNLRPVVADAEGPKESWSAHALRHLRARREGLAEHSPRALELAATVLGAVHAAAVGHIPAIRADRPVRKRAEQLAGERALPLEDLAAIALEGAVGHAAVLAGLRVLAAALGYELRPVDPAATEVNEAATAAAHGSVAVLAGLTAARADGVTTPAEAADVIGKIDTTVERLSEARAGLVEIAGHAVLRSVERGRR